MVKNGNFTLLLTFSWQLLTQCNWLSSWLHPLHNILSSGTFSVPWSSGNFCNISQNMHSQAPVASQHEKTNKVVWTCKDDWPPQRTSTYERPFTWEGNYLVWYSIVKVEHRVFYFVIRNFFCDFISKWRYKVWKGLKNTLKYQIICSLLNRIITAIKLSQLILLK